MRGESSDRCRACPVRSLALCSSLTDEELPGLRQCGRRQRVARGETIFWTGEDSLVCGNLTTGVLKLTASTADGREQIVGLLYPGDFVGSLFGSTVGHSVTALTDAEVCVFPRWEFELMLERHPAMERLMLRRTLGDLENSRNRMLLLGRGSAQERVVSFLLDMARRLTPGHAQTAPFDLPLSRQGIADVLGLTIETVCRQMTRLKADGLIELAGTRTVRILHPSSLGRLAEAA
jgi:CRP/FNR family transcriptional regulator